MKKIILITGASSGIGKETAKLLLQNNHIVYCAARRIEKMTDLKDLGAKVLSLDVTNEQSMILAVEEIIKQEGKIDVLINNAGYGSYGAVEDVPLPEAKYQFEVNVFGLARLTQLVLPHMRKQQSGRIINISSMAGKFGEPLGGWYHATKYAVEGLSDCLRMELDQFNIKVILIEPGAIKTEWDVIAENNLLKISGETDYKDLAIKHAAMFKKIYAKGSSPVIIAEIINKAINDKKPKTRYVAGSGAKIILFMKKILSDKLFDKIMLGQMK